jgi:hypothetical protein
MGRLNLVIAVALLLLGVVLLLINLGMNPVALSKLWPVFPVVVGVLFLSFSFGSGGQRAFLMPAVILVLTGLVFFFCTFTTWENMVYLWPIFVLAPGIGFLVTYAAGERNRPHLVWGGVLSGLALLLFIFYKQLEILWPSVLIVMGLVFLFLHLSRKSERSVPESPQTGGGGRPAT